MVPGDSRPAYTHAAQARQILNDAEDDLREWQPELDDDEEHEPERAAVTSNVHQEKETLTSEAPGLGDGTNTAASRETGKTLRPPLAQAE